MPLIILIALVLVAGFMAGYLAKNLLGSVSKKKDEY
jgi:archaellin